MPKLRSIESDRVGRCPMCDAPWGVEGEIWAVEGVQGWFCRPECALMALERTQSPSTAQTVPEPRYTPPKVEFARPEAPNAFEEPCLTREERMEKMHDENMEASYALVNAIVALTKELSWIGSKLKFPPQG